MFNSNNWGLTSGFDIIRSLSDIIIYTSTQKYIAENKLIYYKEITIF
jgi:hypothetical protein